MDYMKKQNILIVHNYYQVPGGEDSVVENEKKMLIDNKHNVYLYTRHNNEIKNKNIIAKLLLPFETIFSLKTYYDIKKIIKKRNIDLIHVHNTLPLISPSVYYIAYKYNIPIVQTVHNFRLLCPSATFTRNNNICEDCVEKGLIYSIKYKCYRNSFIQSLISALNLKLHRILGTYKKIDGYIALTQFNKLKLKNIIDEDKIFVKPNFVKLDKCVGATSNRRNFLFVGRIDELKGIKLLIDSWMEVENANLYIIGDGPIKEEIKALIIKNDIKNIFLLGFKTKEEVMKLMRETKALIVPSQWYEGFPMTIVEGLSQGTPIIAGNIGSLPSIIDNEVNGLIFKYNSKKDLINKINRINNDDKLLGKLSRNAFKTYEEKYTEMINYKLLNDIYVDVMRMKK